MDARCCAEGVRLSEVGGRILDDHRPPPRAVPPFKVSGVHVGRLHGQRAHEGGGGRRHPSVGSRHDKPTATSHM
eukprot:scaffold3146_cov98-Isochrysis_galbana.AAC.5